MFNKIYRPKSCFWIYWCMWPGHREWLLMWLAMSKGLDCTAPDQEVRFSQHRNQLIRSCYYELSQSRVISHSLFHDSAVIFIYAFVISRWDPSSSIVGRLYATYIGPSVQLLILANALINNMLLFPYVHCAGSLSRTEALIYIYMAVVLVTVVYWLYSSENYKVQFSA